MYTVTLADLFLEGAATGFYFTRTFKCMIPLNVNDIVIPTGSETVELLEDLRHITL